MKQVRTRIAPSPTGEDLHIGNAYTALINYVFAKKNSGKFIVRIEDTDRTRLVQGSEKRILSSLKWLGLIPNESPEIGGKYGPYRQSERLTIYNKYAQELVAIGKAYYCFCTPLRLDQMRKDQQAKGKPPLYDGLCKMLSKVEVKRKITAGEKHVIRLNVRDGGFTRFVDIIRGEISFENKLIDDQILLKSDGYPTYHLGVVVDDHLMEISHVIRGEEWISSTPKHIILYEAFGWSLPLFAHIPLLRNPDKSKLSKRKNPVWVSWYKEQGFLPEALINYLALMGWSHPEGKDIFTLEEFIEKFTLERLQTSGPVFDITKLRWVNEQKLNNLPIWEYSTKISGASIYHPKTEEIKPIVPLVRPRIKTLKEYDTLAGFFYKRPGSKDYELDFSPYKDLLAKINNELNKIDENNWKADTIGDTMEKLVKAEEMKNSEFCMVIRIAITGKKISPPLNESMEILGKDETMARLKGLSS